MTWTVRNLGKATAILAFASAAFVSAGAQARTFKVLHSFTGSDGANPAGRLIEDADGNLYGTSINGGANGKGTVFKLTARGKESVLYSFTGGNDGGSPNGGVIRDASGNFYGTAPSGGASNHGVIFRLTRRGREIVLHSFVGQPDGADPNRGLVADADGNLYGTTSGGGADDDGTVFRVTPRGRETVLDSFGGSVDGISPEAGLFIDARGNLFGTTTFGGVSNFGTVFELPVRNNIDTVLYAFTGSGDGANPVGGVVRDAAGNLYGTTGLGGRDGAGTVFKLTPRGKESVLYSFRIGDGYLPETALIIDDNGNLYGTTVGGGAHNAGTVFEVTPAGREILLHSFTGGNDGGGPNGALLMDSSGNIYGTANSGGASGDGVVFEISP